jgi:hypothetical protein
MNGHSKLAPSSATRWTACTASVGFIEENAHLIPSDTGSTFADEGTRAHDLAKGLLLGEKNISVDDAAMGSFVNDYVAFVRKDTRAEDTAWIERKVPLFYYEQDTGTVDACIFAPDRIIVKDLKYGAGVSVYAENNKQLAIYAESIIRMIEEVDEVKPETPVVLQIYQPRDRNDPEPVREWKLTRGELAMFCWQIQESVTTIEKGEVVFKAEPQTICRWCPAKGFCRHYANYGLTALPVLESPLDATPALPEPNALTREQRCRVLQSKKDLESWLEAVEDQEMNELLNGAEPLAFKLVAGKANRVWVDEAAVDTLLSNHLDADTRYVPRKLVSPAEAEKRLKGKELSTKFENRLAGLITKPEGKPTLAPITDKRPALEINKTTPFSNLESGAELV